MSKKRQSENRAEELLRQRVAALEEELAASKVYRYALAAMLPETVFEMDVSGRLTFVNDAAFEKWGYTREDFDRGLTCFDMIVPEEHEVARARLAARYRGEDGPTTYTARRKDGSTFAVTVHALPLFSSGRPAGMRGFIIDQSQRKQHEDLIASGLKLAVGLNAACRLDDGLDLCLEAALEISAFEAGAVHLNDGQGNLRLRRCFGLSPAFEKAVESGALFKYAIPTLSAGKPCHSPPLGRSGRQRKVFEQEGFKAADIVPMLHKGELLGCVFVASRKEAGLAAAKLQTLEAAAAQMGSAVFRLKIEAELREQQMRLRELAAELATAEERERRRIAEGLHDRVAQTLALCKIRTAMLRNLLHEEAQTAVCREIEAVLDEAIRESRSLVFELSPPILHDLGLGAALEWLAERMGTAFNMRWRVSCGGGSPLSEEVRCFVFQAVRELLVNAGKHAHARLLRVTVDQRDDVLRVTVQDDGDGFPTVRGDKCRGGFGLFNIQQRLTLLGGRLRISSKPGAGSKVVMHIPLSAGA